MSVRIKRGIENILYGVMWDESTALSIIKGSDQSDINSIEKPRIFINVISIENIAGFEGEAIFEVDVEIIGQYGFSETNTTDADAFYSQLSALYLSAVQAKALSLYPSVNVSYSQFHIDQINQVGDSTEFDNMTVDHRVLINIKMQELSTA